ncbi:MAG TPA: hypothetical protein VGE10_00245 [Zeimonas sp.]
MTATTGWKSILAAALLALLGSAPAHAALMQYTIEGRLTADPNQTGIPSGSGFTFTYSLYSNAPYDPFLGVRPRYRLHEARVEIASLGFVGRWSESDFSSGLEGHVWVNNDVAWNPPDIVDAYEVDFDVADPAGGFRFEWDALDDDALMLASDGLPTGGGFLAGADRFHAIFTVPLGRLGCADENQGRCYVYGETDGIAFSSVAEPDVLALLGVGLAGLAASSRRKRAPLARAGGSV